MSYQLAIYNNKLSFWSSSKGYINSNANVPLNTWTHVAVSRESGVLRLFINGVFDRQIADTTSYSAVPKAGIGTQVSNRNASYDFYGNLDQLRVTKNLARFTTSFTPSTTPYDYEEAQASSGEVRIVLEAVRDGLTSHQKQDFSFNFEP